MFTYDGKAMFSYPGVTHARFALVIVGGRVIGVKIVSLCYIILLFSYITRVRFGSGVRLEPKEKLNMFYLRKSLKVGQTTVFCRA